MFQRVRMAFEFFVESLKQPSTPTRRSVRLDVVRLEERATPAVTFDLLAPVEPPPVHLIAAPAPAAPAQPVIVLASDTTVRADLFGVGETEEQVNELEEMLAEERIAQEEAAEITAAIQEVPEDTSADVDAGETPIIEDTIYLPPVE